jgi:hypothetical protein
VAYPSRRMSHRQEEKERRRQERLAAEQAAARAHTRRRRLQIGGAVLVIAAIAVVLALTLAGGSDSSGSGSNTDLAAGCTFTADRSEGRDHTDEKVTYDTNPPTSGPHNPVPAQDGVYSAGNEPAKENWVHSLEHGRVLFQYKPGTPAADVAKLRSLAEEPLNDSPGYHTLVFQNNTDMRAQFALVAWTKSLTCDRLTDASMDVMRSFREQYTDKAPELIP